MLAVTLSASGCGGDDDEPAAGAAAPGTSAEDAERDEAIARAVFERGYSECASFALERLSAKYHVARNAADVSLAVARAWAREFGGGEFAVRRGRAGCLQGMRHRADSST